MQAYEQLEQRFARISLIDNAASILDWDTAVIMPRSAGAERAEQMAALSGIAHQLIVAPEMADLLAQAEEEASDFDAWRSANLQEMRRAHAHATAVPQDLVEACAIANGQCEIAWREARPKSDFASVRPFLAEVLNLRRRVGEAKGAAFGLPIYDALMESYDPGLRRDWLDKTFAALARELPELIGQALAAQARRPALLPFRGPFSVEAQKVIGGKILGALGFDFDRGRFDVSLHPFCGGTSGDLRITTRYDENDFSGSLMGLLHEGGHALYEQGLPAPWVKQPVGRARGMSMHESQSLLIEHYAGLSPEFLSWLTPLVREAFGVSGPEWTAENLFRTFTRVQPQFIRVDADEVTYPAHVMMRYELERAMISGDLEVAELPGAFNAKMKQYLGLDVPDDRRGCLQDIHWYGGSFGYFPTYCVGAMMAAQLYGAARSALPSIGASLGQGDFTPLRAWLNANVHARARSVSSAQIIQEATGEPLDARHYLAHLRGRYVG